MIQLYTTNNCQYCDKVKLLLKELGVGYEEINVSNDPVKREELIMLTGIRAVPVLINGSKFVVGFNKEDIKDLLNDKN